MLLALVACTIMNKNRGVVRNIKMQTTYFGRSGNWFGLSITIYITFSPKKKKKPIYIILNYFDRSLKSSTNFSNESFGNKRLAIYKSRGTTRVYMLNTHKLACSIFLRKKGYLEIDPLLLHLILIIKKA